MKAIPIFEMKLRNIFGKQREKEIDILCALINKDSNVLDVGANRGTYSYPVARRVNEKGHVFLFEPLPKLYDYLSEAFRTLNQVTVFKNACGHVAGKKSIKIPLYSGSLGLGAASFVNDFAEFQEIQIDVIRIDDLNLPRVDFIKIDVEGYETFVLKGAVKTIERSQPLILVEIDWNMGNQYFEELTNLISSINYRVFALTRDRFLDVELGEFKSLNLNFHDLGYRNNFFLVPAHRLEETKIKMVRQKKAMHFLRRFL